MKNPFIKDNNSGLWIAAAITGAIAASVAAWYYFKGGNTEEPNEHTTDYLKPKPLPHKKKTNLHDLHTIAG